MNLDRKTKKKKKKKKKKKVVMDTAERIIAQRGGTEPFGYKKKQQIATTKTIKWISYTGKQKNNRFTGTDTEAFPDAEKKRKKKPEIKTNAIDDHGVGGGGGGGGTAEEAAIANPLRYR